MINITSKLARRLYLAEFIRRMTVLENIQTREFKPVLNRQYMNAARFVQQGVTGIDAVDHAVDHERDRLVALMARHYRRVSTVFGNKTFKIIENSKSICVPEIKGPVDEFWKELNLWTRVQTGSKITKVQGTTKKLIARVIQRGMQEGESHVEIAKRIRKTGRIATSHRARTIALTETHTAACKSVDVAIKSTRIEMEKEWLATMDKRTRPDHANADGQRVDQNAKFKVGMALMAYPGDPAGGADQVVRCRCTCLYHTVKRMDKLKPYKPEEALGEIIPGSPVKSADDILQHYRKSEQATLIEGKSARELKANIAERLGERLLALKSDKMDDFIRFVSGTEMEFLGIKEYKFASRKLIQQWAGTSGDNCPRSIMMQLAARKEFGLKGSSIWWDKEVLKEANELFKIHGKAARRFLREMYKNTQEHLASRGLKSVRVVRGYRGDIGVLPATLEKKMAMTKLEIQPMSSFSSDLVTAKDFATVHPSVDLNASLIFAEVPANRVLSTPVTGYGCMNELEFVILGGIKEGGETMLGSTLSWNASNWEHLFPGTSMRLASEEIYKATKK